MKLQGEKVINTSREIENVMNSSDIAGLIIRDIKFNKYKRVILVTG